MTAEEIRSQREKCTDCGGQLQEIVVFHLPEVQRAGLSFASHDAKKLKVLGNSFYPKEGTVLAFLCSSCARIAFYGAVHLEKDASKKATASGRETDHA